MHANEAEIIRRSDKGLTISGSRVTLYAVMDYLHAGRTPEEIREWLALSAEQMRAATEYIASHRKEVEEEYRDTLRKAAERRQYWDARLREHLDHTPARALTPEQAALYAKLAAQRGQLIEEMLRDDISEMSEGTRQ